MPDWISVKERLPEESGEVLVCCAKPKNYIRLVPYSDRFKAFNVCDGHEDAHTAFNDVTHWMPLPEPPKTEKEETNVTEGI